MLFGNTTMQSTVVHHVNPILLVRVSLEPSYYIWSEVGFESVLLDESQALASN